MGKKYKLKGYSLSGSAVFSALGRLRMRVVGGREDLQ